MSSATPSIGSNLLPRRISKARRWIVLVSLIAHTAAIGAYVVVGMLRIERLQPAKAPISVTVGLKMSDPGGGLEAGQRPKDPPKDKPPIRETHDTVQPVKNPAQVSTDGVTTTSELPGIGVKGDPELPPGPPGGDCLGPDCATDGEPKPPVKVATVVPPPKQEEVGATVFKGLRKTGQTQISPDDVTKSAMMRDGKDQWFAMVRLCLDTAGRVTKADVVKSTGYPAYDRDLRKAVSEWTYSAYRVNDTPVPVCSTVRFAFSMK